MKKRFLLFLILALLSAGCTTQTTAEESPGQTDMVIEAPLSTPRTPVDLNISAAASLTEPFEEIGKLFEAKHPGVTIIFNFANSQQLAQQINEGAPADVFASANPKQMIPVIEAGEVVSGTQQTFAKNQLVVIYPQDNPAGLIALIDLAKPGLKLVFAAKEVPVGGYSLNFLDKASADPAFGMNFKDKVLNNVVSYEDNVKAVLTKVALGEADAGIVYTSDIAGQYASKVGELDIPEALNVIASYPIAPIKNSPNPELAKSFIDLVLDPEGQNILAKYNFVPVK